MLFSDVRQVVSEFARGSVRINDEGVSLGGVDRVVDGIGLFPYRFGSSLQLSLDNHLLTIYYLQCLLLLLQLRLLSFICWSPPKNKGRQENWSEGGGCTF